MITSSAPGPILDKLRRLAGPNPGGSKLTDGERLHLIYLVGVRNQYAEMMEIMGKTVTEMTIKDHLVRRGLTFDDIAGAFEKHGADKPVAVVDAIAVHPSLKSTTDMYLD